MKAKKVKWCEGDREKLADLVPLEAPISIQIEPANICNFRCNYCLQSREEYRKLYRANLMSMEMYGKIVEGLEKFNGKIKTVVFARQGEPTLNPNLPEMIKILKDKNICQQVKIITNGSMLNPQYNLKLIESGLDVIRISLQGLDTAQYQNICGVQINMEEFIFNIKHFYENRKQCKVFIKILDKMIEGQEDLFYSLFGDICDEISVEHLIDIDENEELNSLNMMNEVVENKVDVCSAPFYSIGVDAVGNILPCCGNSDKLLNIGNIELVDLYDYWHSDWLLNFQIMQLKGERYNCLACKNCCVPTACLQKNDLLDEQKDRILALFNELR